MVTFEIIFTEKIDRRMLKAPTLSNKGNNKLFLDSNGRNVCAKESSLGWNEFLIYGYTFGFRVGIYDENHSVHNAVSSKHNTDPEAADAKKFEGGSCKIHALPMLDITKEAKQGLRSCPVSAVYKQELKLTSAFPYIKTELVVEKITVRVPVTFAEEKRNHFKTKKIKIDIPDAKPGKCSVFVNTNGTVAVVAG